MQLQMAHKLGNLLGYQIRLLRRVGAVDIGSQSHTTRQQVGVSVRQRTAWAWDCISPHNDRCHLPRLCVCFLQETLLVLIYQLPPALGMDLCLGMRIGGTSHVNRDRQRSIRDGDEVKPARHIVLTVYVIDPEGNWSGPDGDPGQRMEISKPSPQTTPYSTAMVLRKPVRHVGVYHGHA